MKMTNKSVTFKTRKPFFCFALACERIVIQMHSTESRRVMGPQNILFARMSVTFSPEILQTGAVKGLNQSKKQHPMLNIVCVSHNHTMFDPDQIKSCEKWTF